MEQSRRKKYENYHISAQKRNRCFFSCVMAKMLTLLSYSTGTDTKIVCIHSDTLGIKYRIFVKVNGQDDFAELQITEVLHTQYLDEPFHSYEVFLLLNRLLSKHIPERHPSHRIIYNRGNSLNEFIAASELRQRSVWAGLVQNIQREASGLKFSIN